MLGWKTTSLSLKTCLLHALVTWQSFSFFHLSFNIHISVICILSILKQIVFGEILRQQTVKMHANVPAKEGEMTSSKMAAGSGNPSKYTIGLQISPARESSKKFTTTSKVEVSVMPGYTQEYINSLVQDCSNCSALALELPQTCTQLSICAVKKKKKKENK